MEAHVTVFGELELSDRRALAAWKKARVDPAAFDNADDEFPDGCGDSTSVGAILERVADLPRLSKGLGQVDVAFDERQIAVRGFLKDDAYRGWAALTAAVFGAAAAAGGTGAVHFVNIAGEYAFTMRVAGGKASLVRVRGRKNIQRIDETAAGEAATLLYTRSLGTHDEAAPPPGPRPAPPGALGDVCAAIIEALASAGEERVFAALRERGGLVPTGPRSAEPITKVYPSGAAVLAALRKSRDPASSALALDLCSRVDPEAAERLGLRALRAGVEGPATPCGDEEVLVMAAAVACSSTDPAVLDALVALLPRPPRDVPTALRNRVAIALRALPVPATTERVLALLSPALLAERNATSVVTTALNVVAARGGAVPPSVALEIWKRRPEPLLRNRAGEVLLASATSEGLEALASAIAEPDALGSLAARALFRLDPAGAYDRLSSFWTGDLQRPPTRQVLESALGALADAAHAGGGPELKDTRWVDLALRATWSKRAIAFLGRSRDPRVPRTLAALLPAHFEVVVEALSRLGDPSALPALEAAAPHAPNPYTKRQVTRVIDSLRRKGVGSKRDGAPTRKKPGRTGAGK